MNLLLWRPPDNCGDLGDAHEAGVFDPNSTTDAIAWLAGFAESDPERAANDEVKRDALEEFTDTGNARELIRRQGSVIRWGEGLGPMVYDENRWRMLREVELSAMAIEALKARFREIDEAAGDTKEGQELAEKAAKHLKSSLAGSRLREMIRLALSFPQIRVPEADAWNGDDYLLNCPNCTVDLRTGESRGHRSSDMITKATRATWDEGAECPEFLDFLETVYQGKEHVIGFVQRMLGYALTGDTSERCFFIFTGRGRNGKGTLLSLVQWLAGDYAVLAEKNTFVSQREGAASNTIAALWGARIVRASETPEGRQLAVADIKQLTGGGETITARFLFKELFTFRFVGKIFIETNCLPRVGSGDEALWDRMRVIDHAVRFALTPEEALATDMPLVDPTLKDRLLLEADGVLKWMVEGAIKWREHGLMAPPEVAKAVNEYRSSEDLLSQFIEEKCDRGPGQKVAASALQAELAEWLKEMGLAKGWSPQRVGGQMKMLGFEPSRGSGGKRMWLGLRLRDVMDEKAEQRNFQDHEEEW